MNEDTPKTDANRLSVKSGRGYLVWKIGALVFTSVVILILLAMSAIAVLLHSERFHSYVLKTVEQKAGESLGVSVRLQNFALNLWHLDLDLYGLTIEGAAPYTNPPLLQIDHAEVGVRIVSFLQRTWYLNSFRIDRPIVHIFVDARGVSNLPTFKGNNNSKSNTTIFDLGVRHAVLDHGEVYYNDHRSELSADLHDLTLQAAFNSLLQKYSGRLSYSDGHFVSGSLKPIQHALEAEFDATPGMLHLKHLKLSCGPSQLLLTATLQNYAKPIVDANYDAVADGVQLGQILKSASVPAGQVRATGVIHYRQTDNRSLLESVVLQGDLNSRMLNIRANPIRTQVTHLAAHYSLENGNANLHDFSMDVLGGKLTGNGAMTNISGDSHAKVNASLRGVSLIQLTQLAGQSVSANGVALTGALNADLTAAWGKNLNDLVAHVDANADGHMQRSTAVLSVNSNSNIGSIVTIDSVIHGVYTAKDKQLALANSYLRTPQTNVTMNGVVSNRSSLNIRLQAEDLREVETIADLFRTTPQGKPLQSLGLAGTASFQGSVEGSMASPRLTGQLIASNFHVSGSSWKVIRANVYVSPSLASIHNADLEPASRGHISINASAGLTKWSFTNRSPIQIDLNVSQLDIAEFAKLTGQQIPVTGTLAADVKLHGTELRPIGNGSISTIGLMAYGQPIPSTKIVFEGTGDEAHANFMVQLPSGDMQGKVSVRPDEKTYTAQLTATGIQLSKLQALKLRNINVAGQVSLNASGQGAFDNPEADISLQIPQLVIQKQTMTGLSLHVSMANHIGNAILEASGIQTNIQAKAKVNLSGDYLADASLDTQAIQFAPILAMYAPEEAASISGQTELHATLHGPLKNPNQIEAHLTVPVLKMAYGSSVQLAATNPIRVDYKNGVVDMQRAVIQGTDTNLQLQGSIPVAGDAVKSAPMSVMLQGTVNLQLAQLFDPDVRSSGELKFDVNSKGPVNGSGFGGQIQIVDAAFASADLPVGLQHGNGVLTLTNDRLSVSNFQGAVGGGIVNAQGGVSLRPQLRFDLGMTARGVRMLYPDGMRESVNANLRLAGSPDVAMLGGTVNLSELSFTPAFDLNNFIGQFSGVASPPTPGFSQNLQLNLAVRSTNDINLISRTLSINGAANLQVRGTAANPVILGRVNLNSGDIILNGDRFLLNGGTIEFVNPSETEPVLNVSLKTTIQQYDIYLRFNGPADQLHTDYNSDPALPSADIINLLAFGQTTEASANNPTPTNQAAESLVASQVSSQVTSRVAKIAGISQLSINPVLAAGSSGPAGANITIQQRVTGNLFVTFSSNVASTQNQTIQGQYQLTPKVAISATRDQNGGVAFDALIKKTW